MPVGIAAVATPLKAVAGLHPGRRVSAAAVFAIIMAPTTAAAVTSVVMVLMTPQHALHRTPPPPFGISNAPECGLTARSGKFKLRHYLHFHSSIAHKPAAETA